MSNKLPTLRLLLEPHKIATYVKRLGPKIHMNTPKKPSTPHGDVMFRIKRGLCGYVSYLAACDMQEAFSEYVLYEPILRIMTACGYKVECEYVCPGVQQPNLGDKKKLDFYAMGISRDIALEVKWITSTSPVLTRDIEKLRAVFDFDHNALPLLCLFGKQNFVANVDISGDGFVERGTAVYADFRRTKYACRVYELTKPVRTKTSR